MTNVNPETKLEEKIIIDFLNKLGFDEITSNTIIKDRNDQIGEIDTLFRYLDYLFIVEISTKKKLDNQKKNFFFSKWSDGHNLRKLRQKFRITQKKTIRIYFDRSTKTPENHAGLDHITKRRKGNKIVYADKFEEFQSSLNEDSSFVRRNFLKWLNEK